MIKPYKLFESEDIDHLYKRIKSYTKFHNRKELVTKTGDISDRFKHYFYDLIDEGWEIRGQNIYQVYVDITLKNILRKDGIESATNDLIDRMSEIRDRMSNEGFESKFIITLNDKAQQIQNPNNHKVPIYKYTGIGDENKLRYYKDGKYSQEEYVFAEIKFYII